MRLHSFSLLGLLAVAGCSSTVTESATCPSPVISNPMVTEQAACKYATGATVETTLGASSHELLLARQAIKHVVVMMKENRSYDHILGKLHDQGQPEAEALPANFSNPDISGDPVPMFHATTTCWPHDPDHQWEAMHSQDDSDKMDGFVQSAYFSTGTDGHFVMSYYDQTDIPFYYWLANTYALSDRHFTSVRSGTFPNRNFLLLATADGVQSTGAGFPSPTTPTIFDAMTAAGVTWGVYSDGSLLSGTLNWTLSHTGAHPFADFITAVDNGTLPQVAFVDGIDNVEDEHPTADVQRGEAWSRNVYEHATASSLWPNMAMFWTYDESGGFFDHVPPPDQACVARPVDIDAPFFELGMRVPFLAISPWARGHSVSHVVTEHTAITRFIETIFDLPALTARDGNSTALLDLFDFTCSPTLLTPPAAPAAGTGGCVGTVVLTADKPVYSPGENINISFTGGSGMDPEDWIAVYPYGPSGATLPQQGALLWSYIGGQGQTAAGAPTSGTVTLNGSVIGTGPWPLAPGGYIAYYLLNGGYASIASVDFTVN